MELYHQDHSFGQDQKRPGEVKTLIVIAITAVMMVVEIASGMWFKSMALLADGLHMASHAAALSVSAFAYIYARRHAHDSRFSFGTGKINALGGYTGAILLALFALLMVWESAERLIHPQSIAFNEAIVVAIIGLLVNLGCVFILGDNHDHGHTEGDSCDHDHEHDHNLRAAYFHVLADALTSVLAILALLAGKYLNLVWLDPCIGVLGAILIARWSMGLIRTTGQVLLDRQAPQEIQDEIRRNIEAQSTDAVVDLHVWSIGPKLYAAEIVIVSNDPQPVHFYKERLPSAVGLAHVLIEVHAE